MPSRPSPFGARPSDVRKHGADAAADAAAEMARFRERVYRLVALIPAGKVATYGQLAALAGHPRRARHVGNALKHAPPGDLPWHRVLNAAGRISPRAGEQRGRGDETVERRQARLLAAEGVPLTGRGRAQRVDLERYRWRPEEDGAALSLSLGRAPRKGRGGGRAKRAADA